MTNTCPFCLKDMGIGPSLTAWYGDQNSLYTFNQLTIVLKHKCDSCLREVKVVVKVSQNDLIPDEIVVFRGKVEK